MENFTADTMWNDRDTFWLLHVCRLCVFPQLGRYTKEGQLFLGPLGSTGEDTHCVVDDQISSFPQLLNCDKVTNAKQKTWHFSQVRSIQCQILCSFTRKHFLFCFLWGLNHVKLMWRLGKSRPENEPLPYEAISSDLRNISTKIVNTHFFVCLWCNYLKLMPHTVHLQFMSALVL